MAKVPDGGQSDDVSRHQNGRHPPTAYQRPRQIDTVGLAGEVDVDQDHIDLMQVDRDLGGLPGDRKVENPNKGRELGRRMRIEGVSGVCQQRIEDFAQAADAANGVA